MKEKDKIKSLESSERFEGSAPNVDLKGQDGGEMGMLKRLGFTPNYEMLAGKTEKEIMKIVEFELVPYLWKQCEQIGWWPDENKNPYEIHKQDDGSFLLVSFLKPGQRKPRLWRDTKHEGIIGVNEK